MEFWTIFLASLGVGFSGAMMPGPLLTVTIGETLRRGFVAGPLIVLGHAILEIALVVLLVLGVAQYLALKQVHTFIALVGGAFLVFMGWSMFRDAWRGSVSLELGPAAGGNEASAGAHPGQGKNGGSGPGAGPAADAGPATGAGLAAGPHPSAGAGPAPSAASKARPGLHPVAAGVLVSLSNPYFTFWWATVGLAFITTAIPLGTSGVVSFTTGHLLSDLIWYGLVSAAVAGGRRFMNQGVYRGIIAVCGVFLVGLGVFYFVFRGLA